MSYDYDGLVQKVHDFRRRALDLSEGDSTDEDLTKMDLLQGAMDTFEKLSQHCPMTPLLWIHYGATAFDFCQEMAKTNASMLDGEEASLASKSSSLETEIQILQLGAEEFQGSLLMRLRLISLLKQQQQLASQLSQPQGQELILSLEQAIENVGKGSYGCESAEAKLVVSLFYEPLAMSYATTPGKATLASDLLLMQQPTRPLPSEDLLSFYKKLGRNHSLPESDGEEDVTIEAGRRLVAKYYYGALQAPQYETTLQALLHEQRLLPPWDLLSENESDDEFWNLLLKPEPTATIGMGYGNIELAQSFVQYADAMANFNVPTMDSDETSLEEKSQVLQITHEINDLALSVYERAVSECPTVELVWTSYINHVEALAQQLSLKNKSKESQQLPEEETNPSEVLASSPSRLQSIARRACRNCPYSLTLAQRQVEIQGFLAHHNFLVLEPDKLLEEIVQPALDSNFLPADSAATTLYSMILSVIQQRILTLLASTEASLATFDTAIDPAKKRKGKAVNQPISEDVLTEIQDLAEDWVELGTNFDLVLSKQKAKSAATARSILAQQRSQSLQHVIQPLLQVSSAGQNEKQHDVLNDEALVVLQKAAKLQNPAHPDTQLNFIRDYFLRKAVSVPVSNPAEIAMRLCHVRFLFQRSVSLSGSGSSLSVPPFQRDFATALQALAFEWVQFERQFGSAESLSRAQKMTKRKLEKFDSSSQHPSNKTPAITSKTAAHPVVAEASATLTASKHADPEPPTATEKPAIPKDVSAAAALTGGNASDSIQDSSATMPTKKRDKIAVKVGNLEYPAHEFTVRVFGLAETVDDADLVETFQNSKKCGRLVHARIMRDRIGKSKGWGLVQFEEREGVEKALALDDNVGIHETTIKVQRSHMPAVPSVVPPGHHRVNPQGEGKATKRNLKRKARNETDPKKVDPKEDSVKTSKLATGVLSFVPRGVNKREKKI